MRTSLAPHSLLIPPALAKEIGLHKAVILQQMHYWLERSNHLINGCRWIYNTYHAWQEQFPFLSLCAIRRALARLEGMNLGIGLFIYAVKSRQKPSLTKLGCGWKEWADEAVKRRLMEYSQSHEGDIMVHFVGGVSKLWSQLRSLSWSEVERIAEEKCDRAIAFKFSKGRTTGKEKVIILLSIAIIQCYFFAVVS